MATTNHAKKLPSPIPPTAMPLLSPPALLQASLSQNPPLRPYTSRTPTQLRPLSLNTSSLTHTNGSSVVKLGASTVVCGVRAEILPVADIPHYRSSTSSRQRQTNPQSQESDWHSEDYSAITHNNLLVPNLELATSSPLFPANQPPSTTAQSLSQRLLTLLHTSKTVPVSDLEIRYTPPDPNDPNIDPDDPAYVEVERDQLKAYWVLYIDCVCLSYDGEGSVFDAAWLAVYAALKDTLLPEASWDEDLGRVICDADGERGRRLGVRGMPVPLSWGVFEFDQQLELGGDRAGKDEHVLLVDLDGFEEGCCEERGCVVVDGEREAEVVAMEKSGGMGWVRFDELRELCGLAGERAREWRGLLERHVGKG